MLRKPWIVNLTWAMSLLLGTAVLYVLSYPAAVKAMGRGNQLTYRPCLGLYVDSPATEPLMAWACIWGDDVQASILIAELETLPSGGTILE